MSSSSTELQLLNAVDTHDIDGVRSLLTAGFFTSAADIEFTDANGMCALLLAVRNNDRRMVSLLLDSNADVFHCVGNASRWIPLFHAVQQNLVDVAYTLLTHDHSQAFYKDADGQTALMVCLSRTSVNMDMMMLLLRAKSDVNAVDASDNSTPLMMAANAGSTTTVRTLLRASANVNAVDKDDSSALMYAATKGDAPMVKLLCRARANLDLRDSPDGHTALVDAARHGHADVVNILLRAGATQHSAAARHASTTAIHNRINNAVDGEIEVFPPVPITYPPLELEPLEDTGANRNKRGTFSIFSLSTDDAADAESEAKRHRSIDNDLVIQGAVYGGVGVTAAHIGASAALQLSPVFTAIFILIESIDAHSKRAIANRSNCTYLARRTTALRPLLESLYRCYAGDDANVSVGAMDQLTLLVSELESTLELLQRYTEASWIRKLLSSRQMHEEFEQQDRRLTGIVGDLTAGMSQVSTQQLQQSMPYVCNGIDEIRVEVLAFQGHMNSEIRELKAMVAGHARRRSLSMSTPLLADTSHTDDELSDADVKLLLTYCVRGHRIGKGTFGSVFLGEFRGVRVAIKELDIGLIDSADDNEIDARILKDFRSEVHILRLLRSSRLVQFVAASTRPPHLLIVTEHLEHGSLYEWIQRRKRRSGDDDGDDDTLRYRVSVQIATGLAFLHEHNPSILHRDLKSQNVMFDSEWNVKLCDFGLSRTLSHTIESSTRTVTGTAQYMSPEALRGERLSVKADIYSFGVLLYELWTGSLPYEGMDLVQMIARILDSPAATKRMRLSKTGVPKPLRPLIKACLHSDPQRRWDINAVLRFLYQAQELHT